LDEQMSTTGPRVVERLPPHSRWPSLHPTTQAAFNEILWKGGLPRIEIARALGVSRARLTAITRDLDDAGLIVEGGREQRSSTGRPAEMLYARTDRYHFLGLHVRHGSVIGVAVDLANRVVWERRIDLPDLDVDAVFDQACQWFVDASAEGLTVAAIAVCAPMVPLVVRPMCGTRTSVPALAMSAAWSVSNTYCAGLRGEQRAATATATAGAGRGRRKEWRRGKNK